MEARTLIKSGVLKATTAYSAERTLEELGRVAFSDIGDLVTGQGTVKALSQMTPDARRAVSSIKTTKYNKPGKRDGIQEDVIELRLWPKLEALVTLARYHGLLKDRLEVTGDKPLRERISQARSRLAAARK